MSAPRFNRLTAIKPGDTFVLRSGGRVVVSGVYDGHYPYNYTFEGYSGMILYWNENGLGSFRDADYHPMDVVRVIKARKNRLSIRQRLINAYRAWKTLS